MAKRLCPRGCGSAEELWRRGAGCAASTLQLMKAEVDVLKEAEALQEADWPCEDFEATWRVGGIALGHEPRP